MVSTDFLIIGGGIIGISIAGQIKNRFPDAGVILIEKETDCGLHASSRNSGVLHAGFYYSADSLKAKFTRNGNQRLTEYCDSRNIPINKCGKLIIAKNEKELPLLDELLDRARKNNVPLQDISEQEARSLEPRVKTFHRALFSPSTSSVDPAEVLKSMIWEAQEAGVEIQTNTKYLSPIKNGALTSSGKFEYKYLVNTAGLYADKIGKDFGFSKNYSILPFKGLYLYSSEPPGSLRTNIYPVPDLRNPFLGIHFTVTVHGKIKIGPTAIPAIWREQYQGFDNFNLKELIEIGFSQMGLFLFSDFDFKNLALEELKKYSRQNLVSMASSLLNDVKISDYKTWGESGIRAQLFNIKTRKLEMDFILEGNEKSMHILNAISPGFTCSLPFADYVCDKIEKHLNQA
ncbi:MAG: L-2-hydroxyglutarate oxidase [Nitrospinota bacterium]|nr:L-2-hydroxyglutarate oxidase [Nitrospinota bacterium]